MFDLKDKQWGFFIMTEIIRLFFSKYYYLCHDIACGSPRVEVGDIIKYFIKAFTNALFLTLGNFATFYNKSRQSNGRCSRVVYYASMNRAVLISSCVGFCIARLTY